jgi:hypothetical protein
VPCQHSIEIDIHDAEGQSFADLEFRPQNSQQKSILFSFLQLLSKPIFHSLIEKRSFCDADRLAYFFNTKVCMDYKGTVHRDLWFMYYTKSTPFLPFYEYYHISESQIPCQSESHRTNILLSNIDESPTCPVETVE